MKGRNKKGRYAKGHKLNLGRIPWNKGKKGKSPPNKLNLPEKDIIRRYKKEKLPMIKIAREFNCSKIVILRILREKNIEIRPSKEYILGSIPWNKYLTFEIDNRIMFGKNHPNWQNGKSFEPYGIEFNRKLKEQIRRRDNYLCQVCGKTQKELKKLLDIHHINYNKRCNLPQNCISLCRKCHIKTNFDREIWIKHFQKLLSKRYNYKYPEEIILKT